MTSSSSSNPEEDFRTCCPCKASLSMATITEEEAERDKEELRVLSHKLSALLRLLLGEKKMVQLGAPDVSSIDLLEKVLRLTGSKISREDDLCSEKCKVRYSLLIKFRNACRIIYSNRTANYISLIASLCLGAESCIF